MTGEILIKAIPGMGLSIEMDVHDVSRADILGCLDGLAAGFHLDDNDRCMLGLRFAMGGLKTLSGVQVTKLELDKTALNNILKNKKDGSDEG